LLRTALDSSCYMTAAAFVSVCRCTAARADYAVAA
jgi:hypothetical protein